MTARIVDILNNHGPEITPEHLVFADAVMSMLWDKLVESDFLPREPEMRRDVIPWLQLYFEGMLQNLYAATYAPGPMHGTAFELSSLDQPPGIIEFRIDTHPRLDSWWARCIVHIDITKKPTKEGWWTK
jgi:hypothetical protein